MFDNRIFNVNGRGKDSLLKALELACIQEGDEERPAKIAALLVHPDFGMILYRYEGQQVSVKLPTALTAAEALPMILAWMNEKHPITKIKQEGWDAEGDHDGSNVGGWRVYCEDWGKVGGSDAICAVKPVSLWLGR